MSFTSFAVYAEDAAVEAPAVSVEGVEDAGVNTTVASEGASVDEVAEVEEKTAESEESGGLTLWLFGGSDLPNILLTGIKALLLALLGYLGLLLKKNAAKTANKEAVSEAVKALEAGVAQTYEGYVRNLKKGAQDGKLTDEERRLAREKAFDGAKSVARGEGLNVLKTWAWPHVQSLIESIIKKKKN